MDSIDITDSTFSLGLPDINQAINQAISSVDISSTNDYNTYIYIGLAIVVIFIGTFIYKYYQTNKAAQMNNSEEDCPGGFCAMKPHQNHI